MERIAYRGWQNCYRLSNKTLDLVLTADVGPRIIRFGLLGGPNEFSEYDEMAGQTGGDEWRIYGGHRLWHAPEVFPRTYYPDNRSVQIEDHGSFVRAIAPVETTTGIQKEIDIAIPDSSAHVRVTHRLHNANAWEIELAPWALSVMRPGGIAIIPLPQEPSSPPPLLPISSIAVWAYTNMADPCWTWGRRYVLLAQSEIAQAPQKSGARSLDGWAAYAQPSGHLVVKRFRPDPQASYPDFGCTVETYADTRMLELETLGPLTRLAPGAAVEHVEDWFLFQGVPPIRTESDVEAHVLPRALDT